MFVSYNWLKDFVDVDCSARELARLLTSVGIEVASIAEKCIPDGVVVARVLDVRKHPNADKLSLCSVDAGTGQPLAVVCGAPNAAAGMTAALATVGTRLSKDFIIKKATIRGVESSGMLCSERELGISDDHSGIIALPAEFEIGKPLSTVYPADTIFEIELTPNRGDCLSMLGVAREIAAKMRRPITKTAQRPQESGEKIDRCISVTIEDAKGCPRYLGRLIRGVKIGPSPLWLVQRLRIAGVRPINNVVDVTNYLLFHYGHPLHAFDYATIARKAIIVRRAQPGQVFVTLDDAERKLAADDLLICDGDKAVALAGIMGGKNSEISQATTDVFLECAYFDPVGIRKTSKRLGCSTASSYRFERGVDPAQGLHDAIDLAAELIRRLAGGTVAPGIIDACPAPLAQRRIALRPAQVARLLGVAIPEAECIATLESLGIKIVGRESGALVCSPPLYRHDITMEADLVEEIGRMYGYDAIPPSLHATVSLLQTPDKAEKLIDAMRSSLAGAGFNEIVTNSMTSEKKNRLLMPHTDPIVIMNPLTPEMAQMRTTMLGSLLETIAYNLNRKSRDNRFFEIGRVFQAVEGQTLARERDIAAIVMEGSCIPASWSQETVDASFYALTGIVEAFAAAAGIPAPSYGVWDTPSSFFCAEAASIRCGDAVRGMLGKIRDDIARAFDVASAVYYAELDITDLLFAPAALPVYQHISPFPAVERDFCFVMDEQVPALAPADEIRLASPLIESVQPFDVYRGEKVGQGKKSIAYAVRMRALDRTMSDAEAEPICAAIISSIGEKFGATLRK